MHKCTPFAKSWVHPCGVLSLLQERIMQELLVFEDQSFVSKLSAWLFKLMQNLYLGPFINFQSLYQHIGQSALVTCSHCQFVGCDCGFDLNASGVFCQSCLF